MKGILITSKDCSPCAAMKAELAEFIASGEIEEVEFEKEPDKVKRLIDEFGANIPGLLIMSNNGKVIAAV